MSTSTGGARDPEGVGAGGGGEESESELNFMDSAMAGFRERARVSNLARAVVIAEALRALGEGALEDEVRLRARAAAHTVAGSAGTFGFHEASERARALEALLADSGGRFDMASRAHRGLEQLALLRHDLGDLSLQEAHVGDDRSVPRSGDQSCP